ncbi:MAG: substrate-binding domain-containing protein [Oscillospiraceae bacterium]|nr:substrate-binding domain-containing protein [Oscillospiraceae bacterium]
MKKIPALLFCFALLLSLVVCYATILNNQQGDEINTLITSATTYEVEVVETATPYELYGAREHLHNNFEKFKINGSTSMIPLHQSLNNLFGNKRTVYHSRTVRAFKDFVAGETDILLGVSYSDELLQFAEDSGVDLGQLPITREAFVFLINKNNPVQSLTTQQIKDIYSGKITNWSEVGGDNAPITAFQRNHDSGSQMRMVKFMDNTPLLEKDVIYYSGMSDIVIAIEDFDSGKYSIAYNMYTFTEKQYPSEDVVMLSVDGVYPTDETILSNEYPLVIYNYIYYDKNNPETSNFAENLYIYLMSGEGQKFINKAGYVNLNEKLDRNLEVDLVPKTDYGDEDILWFYNKEKGEFYEPDGQGGLLVFDNYADYVLRDTDYINHAGAREFVMSLFNADIELHRWATRIFTDCIYFNPDSEIGGHPLDAIVFKYNDMYFHRLYYDIKEDKLFLKTADNDYFSFYLGYLRMFYPEYIENYEIDYIIEININDLSDVYIMKDNKGEHGDPLEYHQIFK